MTPARRSVDGGDGTVTVADRFTYAWGDRRRPRIHPLRTPAGHVLSRDEPEDHPWHHGLWFTIKFVDGDNFWEELPPYGVLRHRERPVMDGDDAGTVSIVGTLDWTRPDRETVAIVEHRTVAYVPLREDAYAVDLDTTLVAQADLRLDRTPFTTWGGYGGLTLRGAGDLVDTTLTLADGELRLTDADGTRMLATDAQANGARSYWGLGHALLIDDFYARLDDPEPFWLTPDVGLGALRVLRTTYAQSGLLPDGTPL